MPATLSIRPDFSLGTQWMYRSLRYTEHEDGSKSDSTGYFIHDQISGDSVIAGVEYRILLEEELALYNTDLGLQNSRTAYAVLSDSTGLLVKTLKGGNRAFVRVPFKTAASWHSSEVTTNTAVETTEFDTADFADEVKDLIPTFRIGQAWRYREPGSALHFPIETKTFLGWDTLDLAGTPVPALEFRLDLDPPGESPGYEWYAGDVKVLTRSSSSSSFDGKDSSRLEESYLGRRGFTRQDTLDILKGTVLDPNAE